MVAWCQQGSSLEYWASRTSGRPVSIGRDGKRRFFLWPKGGDIGDVKDRPILFVEDNVCDGQRSPRFAEAHFMEQGAKDVLTACVLKDRGEQDIAFFGQEVDDVPSHPYKPSNPGDRQ